MTTQPGMKGARPEGQYWASVSTEDIGSQVAARFRKYRELCEKTGRLSRWRLAFATYTGRDPMTGSLSELITEGGEDGELLGAHLNFHRRLVRQQITLATGDRPLFKAMANNDSPESLEQTIVAEQLATYELGDGQLNNRAKEGIELERIFGEAFFVQTWDAAGGEEIGVEDVPELDDNGDPVTERLEGVDPMTGEPVVQEVPRMTQRPVHEGSIGAEAYSPVNVARDLGVRRLEHCQWHIVRERVCRWDLAEQYPEKRSEILNEPAAGKDEFALWERTQVIGDETDQIYKYTLYHAKTKALPQGRETLIVGETALRDTPLAYKTYPVLPIVVSEEPEEGTGYSEAWDMLSPQQALNATASGILTTHDAGSINNWVATASMGVEVDDLRPGLRLCKFTPDPSAPNLEPHPMQMPEVRQSSFELASFWERVMQTLSAVNDVVLGKSEGKSGAHDALLSAQAVQAQSAIQQIYLDLLQWAMTMRVQLYQVFATEERTIEIVGTDDRSLVRSFKGDTIKDVRRFTVSMASPDMRTFEGRQGRLQMLLKNFPGQITPEQAMTMMDTGRYQPTYKAQRKAVDHLGRENEKLMRGEPVLLDPGDHHELHIREHTALKCDPDVRFDDARMRIINQHIQEHQMQWSMLSMDPMGIILLAATGQRPAPPPPMMGAPPPPGDPNAPMPPQGEQGAPPPMGEQMAAPRANVPGAPPDIAGVKMPQMPTNPETGAPASVPGAQQ